MTFVEEQKQEQHNNSDDDNHIDYRHEGGPCLSLLWSEEEDLQGQSLYLGGEEVNGKIYCIPGHAPQVLAIDTTSNDRVYPIGPKIPGKFKWLRGIVVGTNVYGLPCHADTVLKIDTLTQEITLLPIDYESFYNTTTAGEAEAQRRMYWKYHGGAAITTSSSTTMIYTIPQSAWHVLKIDTSTDTCSLVPSEPMRGKYKWYGGVLSQNDGSIYGIPHNATSVLQIDPCNDDKITLHGNFPPGNHKWHGASVAQSCGTIVGVPNNADTVLLVKPGAAADGVSPEMVEISSPEIQTGRHRSDGKYKFLGAMTGAMDGNVYCFPSGSEYVLEVNPTAAEEDSIVKVVGTNLYPMEEINQNKWQNGVAFGKYIYAIPLAAKTVLQIDTTTKEITTWKLPQNGQQGLAKWEGGLLSSSGNIYCVPNNSKAVLKITAPGGSVDSSIDESDNLLVEKLMEDHKTTNERTRNTNGALNNSTTTTTTANNASDASNDKSSSSPTTTTTSEESLLYKTGIPTLRSSAHRVKYSPKNRNSTNNSGRCLPPLLCESLMLDYDTKKYNFGSILLKLLQECDMTRVGSCSSTDRLEDWRVPKPSMTRKHHGGSCEDSQAYLSQQLSTHEGFLALFDDFVETVVLRHLKRQLVSLRDGDNDDSISFYYQRPPTLRLQPGPARAHVKAHCDAQYGHQDGEVNFWLPMTDRTLNEVDLYLEGGLASGNPADDSNNSNTNTNFEPMPVEVGQVLQFHGTRVKHYVNANTTPHTRVSMDFRVGIEGYFDPQWAMVGTTSDHTRRKVRL